MKTNDLNALCEQIQEYILKRSNSPKNPFYINEEGTVEIRNLIADHLWKGHAGFVEWATWIKNNPEKYLQSSYDGIWVRTDTYWYRVTIGPNLAVSVSLDKNFGVGL